MTNSAHNRHIHQSRLEHFHLHLAVRVSPSSRPSLLRLFGTLTVGTIAISTSAPFIKLAGMRPFALASGRLLGVAILYALVGRDLASAWRGLERRERARAIFAGMFLAAHLGCWIWAFEFTDLPSAVLLLVLQPLFAAWFGSFVFREKVTSSAITAVILAIAGLLIITFDDLTISPTQLVGDALAAAASLFMVIFMSLGRTLRPRMSLPAYMTMTYGGAGVWSLILALLMGVPLLGYPTSSYLWLLGLIFITTGVGHAAFNYVLPHVRLFTVNIATVAEPALSILGAVLFLGQRLTVYELMGGILLVAALFVGVRDEKQGTAATQIEQVALE